MTSSSRFVSMGRVAVASFLVLAAVHCSGGSSQHPPTQTTSVVGSNGGTAASSDGTMTVEVPSGALASNVAITVSPATTSVPGVVGEAWVLGPAGTTFSKPVTLTLSYASAGGGSSYRVATYANGALTALSGYSLDASAQTVSGTTTTVGTFGLVAASSSTTSTADAGSVCFSMSGGASCEGGGGSSSGSSGAGGGSTSGSGGTCTVSTCAASNTTICAQYPGSSLSSCVDGANGYAASCCYPAGQPVCIVDSPGVACGGSSGSGSGGGTGSSTSSGGFTCDTPTCAASSPCSGYTGTTVTSCTDSSTGYSATCCYPVGTIPSSTPVSGGSSSGSSSGGGTVVGSSSGGSSGGSATSGGGSSSSSGG